MCTIEMCDWLVCAVEIRQEIICSVLCWCFPFVHAADLDFLHFTERQRVDPAANEHDGNYNPDFGGDEEGRERGGGSDKIGVDVVTGEFCIECSVNLC